MLPENKLCIIAVRSPGLNLIEVEDGHDGYKYMQLTISPYK